MKALNVIALDGHSGFEVLLYEQTPGVYVVRKQTKHSGQNSRLRVQHKKHIFFQELGQDLFFVPEIINSGQENKLFFYEYKFVEGVTLLRFIENEPLEKITKVLDGLVNIIKYFNGSSEAYEQINVERGLGKILTQKIAANLKHHPKPEKLEQYIRENLKKIPEIKHRTICHGDLTFDNIIIDKQGNIWLIDFLELFYPHYWFDIAKLFQDIDGKWYEFKYNMHLPHNKLAFVRDYFLKSIGEFDPEYVKQHNFLLLTALLRILPYLKSEQEKQFIFEKINFFASI